MCTSGVGGSIPAGSTNLGDKQAGRVAPGSQPTNGRSCAEHAASVVTSLSSKPAGASYGAVPGHRRPPRRPDLRGHNGLRVHQSREKARVYAGSARRARKRKERPNRPTPSAPEALSFELMTSQRRGSAHHDSPIAANSSRCSLSRHQRQRSLGEEGHSQEDCAGECRDPQRMLSTQTRPRPAG
jgi:hypothetical protein